MICVCVRFLKMKHCGCLVCQWCERCSLYRVLWSPGDQVRRWDAKVPLFVVSIPWEEIATCSFLMCIERRNWVVCLLSFLWLVHSAGFTEWTRHGWHWSLLCVHAGGGLAVVDNVAVTRVSVGDPQSLQSQRLQALPGQVAGVPVEGDRLRRFGCHVLAQ